MPVFSEISLCSFIQADIFIEIRLNSQWIRSFHKNPWRSTNGLVWKQRYKCEISSFITNLLYALLYGYFGRDPCDFVYNFSFKSFKRNYRSSKIIWPKGKITSVSNLIFSINILDVPLYIITDGNLPRNYINVYSKFLEKSLQRQKRLGLTAIL